MKKSILFNILIFSSIIITAQTQDITDSLYQKLHQEVNIENPSSGRSDIVWERIVVPDSVDIKSFTIFQNELYIGAMFGGAYKYLESYWEFLGPAWKTVFSFEQYNTDELLLCTSAGFFLWDNDSLILMDGDYFSYAHKIGNYFLGYHSFGDLSRSTDSCSNWDMVLNLPGTETINGLTYTSTDSVFIGTTNFTGNGGGVYLSADSGLTWNHIGLEDHFIASMGVDNNNVVYAGNFGHYVTSHGGLYSYNYNSYIWDTIFYFPFITSIVFNSENHLYTGFSLSGADDWGGVMHSENNGETWMLDTVGMGNTWVSDIQISNNGYLYALAGYPTKKLYKTILPVYVNRNICNKKNIIKPYPNPVNKTLSLQLNNDIIIQNEIFITVYSIKGREIINRTLLSSELLNNPISIDVSKLNTGIFLLLVEFNNQKFNFKFIKQ